MVNIVAIDPGKKTGVAYCTLEDPLQGSVFYSEEWEYFSALVNIEHWLTAYGAEAVVVEAYVIGPATLSKSRGDNWSLEAIGAVRYMCHKAEINFFLQPAGDAKRFVPDEKLAAMELDYRRHRVGGEGHADDAMRHLLAWLAKNQASRLPQEYLEVLLGDG